MVSGETPVMNPSAVICDFDGTIVDTEWPVYETARVAHEAHGLRLPIEDWVRIVGSADNKPLVERLRDQLGREPDPDVLTRAKDQHRAVRETAPTLPGVHEFLDTIASAGRPLGIASSSPMDWVGGHLDRLGLFERFTSFSTRDQVDRGKPAPTCFFSPPLSSNSTPQRCLSSRTLATVPSPPRPPA